MGKKYIIKHKKMPIWLDAPGHGTVDTAEKAHRYTLLKAKALLSAIDNRNYKILCLPGKPKSAVGSNPKPFNKLSPAQVERLALLLEEAGEVQQIIGKILRHGYESCHPDHPGITNRRLLENEIGDFLAAKYIMSCASDIEHFKICDARDRKLAKIGKYLHHQKKVK